MLPINFLVKTDHKAVILPPGNKLKPLRYKVKFKDYRHHGKIGFVNELKNQDWSKVYNAVDINNAVKNLQNTIAERSRDVTKL